MRTMYAKIVKLNTIKHQNNDILNNIKDIRNIIPKNFITVR